MMRITTEYQILSATTHRAFLCSRNSCCAKGLVRAAVVIEGIVSIETVLVGSEAIPIVIIACRVWLVCVSSRIIGSNVSRSSVARRAERHAWVARLNVPSSVCEEDPALVVEDEVEDEAGVDIAAEDEAPDELDGEIEVEADFDANAKDEAEDEVDDEAEGEVDDGAEDEVEDEAAIGNEVEEGGLPIAAAFVVIRAPPLVSTTPDAALLPELAVQLEVSTLVRLK